MTKLFNVREIFNFAIQIENNGERFYRTYRKKIREKITQELFDNLADDEVKHRKIFEDMLVKLAIYQPPETYPDEYHAYLRAYVDNIIFTPENLDKEIGKIKEISDAVEFGIRRELESILYYTETKKFVPLDQHKILEQIIQEEHRHYLRLSELRKSYP